MGTVHIRNHWIYSCEDSRKVNMIWALIFWDFDNIRMPQNHLIRKRHSAIVVYMYKEAEILE